MKRDDRKNTGHNPHPQPDKASTAEQKRSIAGDVHVRGEVTVQPSSEEIFARRAETDKEDTRERKRWRLEIVSLGVLTFYAALTFGKDARVGNPRMLQKTQPRRQKTRWRPLIVLGSRRASLLPGRMLSGLV
jgi:hypothetical protein